MKATSTFKMPRHLKTRLSMIRDPKQRSEHKKSLIEAILFAQLQERSASHKARDKGASLDE
jgi:hypothetical protein